MHGIVLQDHYNDICDRRLHHLQHCHILKQVRFASSGFCFVIYRLIRSCFVLLSDHTSSKIPGPNLDSTARSTNNSSPADLSSSSAIDLLKQLSLRASQRALVSFISEAKALHICRSSGIDNFWKHSQSLASSERYVKVLKNCCMRLVMLRNIQHTVRTYMSNLERILCTHNLGRI